MPAGARSPWQVGRCPIVPYDTAYRPTEAVGRSIFRRTPDGQGEYVSLTKAIEMQLDSGAPVERVLRSLADAVLALAAARGVQRAGITTRQAPECRPHRSEGRGTLNNYQIGRAHV